MSILTHDNSLFEQTTSRSTIDTRQRVSILTQDIKNIGSFGDIIAGIAASLKDRAVILVIIYVEIFITGFIVFIGDVNMCVSSHWQILFNIRVFCFACELRTELIFL